MPVVIASRLAERSRILYGNLAAFARALCFPPRLVAFAVILCTSALGDAALRWVVFNVPRALTLTFPAADLALSNRLSGSGEYRCARLRCLGLTSNYPLCLGQRLSRPNLGLLSPLSRRHLGPASLSRELAVHFHRVWDRSEATNAVLRQT